MYPPGIGVAGVGADGTWHTEDFLLVPVKTGPHIVSTPRPKAVQIFQLQSNHANVEGDAAGEVCRGDGKCSSALDFLGEVLLGLRGVDPVLLTSSSIDS